MRYQGNEFSYRARRDLTELQDAVVDQRRTARKNRRKRERKINELQDDIEFLALMNRALLEVVIKAGLCDADEFAALVEALDLADGKADGGLDVDDLREEAGMAEEEVDKVEAFREAYQQSLARRRGRGRKR